MKIIPAIAAERTAPKSLLLEQRKIVCVVLSPDDLDKLQDRQAMTINLDDYFTELPKCSVVLVYHPIEEEAIQAFKENFDLVYLDERRV